MSLSKTQDLRQPLSFDDLESRVLLAGNVKVALVGEDLVVRGDNYDNSIEINAYDDDYVAVTGLDGTKINGSSDTLYLEADDIENLVIKMRGGNDDVYIQNYGYEELEIDGYLIYNGGSEDDDLSVGTGGEFEAEGVDANGTSGRDSFVFGPYVEIDEGLTRLRGGSGNDGFFFTGGNYDGGLMILGGQDRDTVNLAYVTVEDGLTTLRGQGGDQDRLILEGNVFEDGLVENGFELP